jgi:hypothetical protein
MHILDGFEAVFDALDEILKIVRKSDGKADAAAKIIARFKLDAEQTDAILELKIYRLAKLEILVIQQELAEKRKRAREIGGLLKRDADLWKIVRSEIEHVQKAYGDARRTEMTGEVPDEEYTADDFIIEEDNVVIVTRDGWVKRQKEVKDIASTRLREGDSVLAVLPGSTRATAAFFSNFGTAYTGRIIDVPASTGYGEPIQSLFKFKDAEKVVAALSLDPKLLKFPQGVVLFVKVVGESDGIQSEIGADYFLVRLGIDATVHDVVERCGAKRPRGLTRISAPSNRPNIGSVVGPGGGRYGRFLEDPFLDRQRLHVRGRHQHDIDDSLSNNFADLFPEVFQGLPVTGVLAGLGDGGGSRRGRAESHIRVFRVGDDKGAAARRVGENVRNFGVE